MISIQERLGLQTEPIEGSIWQWLCMLRSAIPGIVQSFDAIKQTCTVRVAIQEWILLPPSSTPQLSDPGTTQNVPTLTTIDDLQDVPILMPRVPGWSMTFPIVEGTECLLVFSDTCIDGWWQNGGVNPPYDRRRHDLSDAIALFGPWSQPNILSGYSTDSVQIRSDDQTIVIDISSSGVKIQGPAVKIQASGGTPIALVNDNFYQWFKNTYMPSVSYVTTAPPLPTNPETSVLKGQ